MNFQSDQIKKIIINNNNKDLVDKVYVHDSIVDSYIYDFKADVVLITLIDSYRNKKFTFKFKDIIFMQYLNFKIMRNGLYVIEWLVYDYKAAIDDVCKNENKTFGVSSFGLAEHPENYIGTAFLLNSADKWVIVCREIEFEEQPLLDE